MNTYGALSEWHRGQGKESQTCGHTAEAIAIFAGLLSPLPARPHVSYVEAAGFQHASVPNLQTSLLLPSGPEEHGGRLRSQADKVLLSADSARCF